jgi:hypothetical protein
VNFFFACLMFFNSFLTLISHHQHNQFLQAGDADYLTFGGHVLYESDYLRSLQWHGIVKDSSLQGRGRMRGGMPDSSSSVAEGKLATAKEELATAKEELATAKEELATAEGKLATAEGKLATAKEELATANKGNDEEKKTEAAEDVATARATVKRADRAVDTAQSGVDTAHVLWTSYTQVVVNLNAASSGGK